MVSLSMTLSDPWPGFQGHGSFKRRISPKWRILQIQLLYRTLIRNHRQAIDRQPSYAAYNKVTTTPLLLHKPCKRFGSVARVCQRQLTFLVNLRFFRQLIVANNFFENEAQRSFDYLCAKNLQNIFIVATVIHVKSRCIFFICTWCRFCPKVYISLL